MHRRDVLERDGREQRERVCDVPEQHVFWDIGDVVRSVPGERAVGGGERGSGVLLLQSRIRARGGLVHVPDMQPGDVEQPARALGVLELLARAVLVDVWRGRERDVPAMSARTVVAGGQRELQPVPGELARPGRERVAQQLCV